jgi:hypothetical protein
MLFGRRKEAGDRLHRLFSVPWDEKTVAWFVETTRLDVKITSITKTTMFGSGARDTLEYEVLGIMTWPKFIAVGIAFEDSNESRTDLFGGFCYNRSDNHDVAGRNVNLPLLDVWLSNWNNETSKAIVEGHRDALLLGRRHSSVRLFKNKGDGVMTDKDREHGWSYESRYSVIGVVTWNVLQSERLPRWALPPGETGFSLEGLPENPRDIKL